jgi:effector-binding domain-containing protein
MQTNFRIRDREATTVIAKRVTVRLADIGTVIGTSFQEVYGVIAPFGAASGEPFIVYHGRPGAGDPPFEIEICAPVDRPLDAPAGWTLTELPAGTFASVTHVGPYDALGTAYDELEAWIGREGYAIDGPPREVYLSEPGTPPADIRTMVEFPVVASGAAVPVASA